MASDGTPYRLLLCSGMQSSGSTLVSWCFLQRSDTDGVLDLRNDILEDLPATVSAPVIWVKQTLGCFRIDDVRGYFEDRGLNPEPLLVVRDLRTVFRSLMIKEYGLNGVTAEDPPLRMRIRRFLADWQICSHRGWPVLQFEEIVRNPREALAAACYSLNLPWDENMVEWPKSREDLADGRYGSPTFFSLLGKTLSDSLDKESGTTRWDGIPADDLDWLEDVGADFNSANGYPRAVERRPGENRQGRLQESFENTRRAVWLKALAAEQKLERLQNRRIFGRFIRRLTEGRW